MVPHREAFVAFDTAKLRNAIAVADAGRNGEIRYLGEIGNTEAATRNRFTQGQFAGPSGKTYPPRPSKPRYAATFMAFPGDASAPNHKFATR
jgi:hypothetical protein